MIQGKHPLPVKVTMPNGDLYVLTLMKIHDRYENGIPENLTLMHDKQVCELTGGEQFMTAYVPAVMMEKP